MKITVCQLHNGRGSFASDWAQLVQHVRTRHSEIVLLPEMPFFSWFPAGRHFDTRTWAEAISAHDEWEARLSELMPAVVLGTRPADYADVRYSSGFQWSGGIVEPVHLKSRLSAQDGSWETSWYEQAAPDFGVATVGGLSIGMLIGPELWTPGQAELYGKDGAHIIAVPRADLAVDSDTQAGNDRWLAGGRAAAKAANTHCISSTRGTQADSPGGTAWIITPDGRTLAVTSADEPVVTVEVDITLQTMAPDHDVAPWNRA